MMGHQGTVLVPRSLLCFISNDGKVALLINKEEIFPTAGRSTDATLGDWEVMDLKSDISDIPAFYTRA